MNKYRSDVIETLNKVFDANPFGGIYNGIILLIGCFFISIYLTKIYPDNYLALIPMILGLPLEIYILKSHDYGYNPLKWKHVEESQDIAFKRLCDLLTSDKNRLGQV